MRLGIPLVSVAGLCCSASAQEIINGGFETGTLSDWIVQNTASGAGAPGFVAIVDIDGPGPKPASNAAAFHAGNTGATGVQGGVELTQRIRMEAGQRLVFSFDWAALRTSGLTNNEGGVFSLIIEGVVIASHAAGPVSSATPQYGHIDALFSCRISNAYMVGVRITRPFSVAPDLTQYVDNFLIVPGPAACYPNCDDSTAAPMLNANDFQCFLNKIASGDSYANCDGSTAPPVLNANDFQCFLNAFAAGCA